MISSEEVQAKLQEQFRLMKEQVFGIEGNTPTAEAIENDSDLLLFVMCAAEFLSSTPQASLHGGFEVSEDGEAVNMLLPIPDLFNGYMQMWLKKQFEGKQIEPTDSVVVQVEAPLGEDNVN